ncbi:MAG: hypothetical protein JW893_08760 [Candidatus Omnitrophica bacterium]|nr:hypothetical protein [Candidatus Omnitrophota bacterium]
MQYVRENREVIEGADLLLKRCGNLKKGEALTIVCDPQTREAADLLARRAKLITSSVTMLEIPTFKMHGEEPNEQAANAMLKSDLCMGITSKSMAHTRARQMASQKGCRYLSLPEYSMDLFADPSLRVDYEKRSVLARYVADVFTQGNEVKVTSVSGTNIRMSIAGRVGNCCPGYVRGPGELGSPPDIEANVSPIENSAEGVVVVDGAIPYPGIGLLKEPVMLKVKGGHLVQMEGNRKIKEVLKRLFDDVSSEKAFILAECGVGLNDRASLRGVMLTDEGAAGTMHFGFGSNSTVGGVNEVSFHLDFVFQKPTLKVDNKVVLEGGDLRLKEPEHGFRGGSR